MKVTKNQLKQLISEEITNIISEENEARCRDLEKKYEQEKTAAYSDPRGYTGGDQYFLKLAKEAGCKWAGGSGATASDKAGDDQEADDDQDETKKAANEIRDLATELEKMLPAGELKDKAKAIIGFVDTRLLMRK
jgi:hypothetical protein